jgi:kynurenine formamidase
MLKRCACFVTLCLMALPAQERAPVTKETVDQWMKELSNWGRWGKEDQLGTINLITPAKAKQGAALVREGVSVSLARVIETEKAVDTGAPFVHTMNATGAGNGRFSIDTYEVRYHGSIHTHLDALSHFFYNGRMYNGYPREEVTDKGAGKLAVDAYRHGFVTRGILMDIPRLKGLKYLEPGTPIYPEDLLAWEKMAGVKVASGDAVFIRTGRFALRAEKGPWPIVRSAAGLHATTAKWLKERDVALLGSDYSLDVKPSGVEGEDSPVHSIALHALGLPLFDNCDLEALSEAAAKQKRWQFLFTTAPLPVPRGTGSPLNPLATF